MDAISYSYADKQAKRIKKFNENPDSPSGILTQPSVIQTGETVTIPAGRTAVMANTVIDGTITLDGTMFIPSGATTDDIDAQLALKAPLENPAFTSAISTQGVNYKSTPISITSWSYVTTTITLNVASHTFVTGDYVEVSGLTATTYPANGIHLVTSATATTIVFTLSATPTGTAGVSSATVKGYATLNGKVLSISNQNIDVSGSRLIFSTYYNTSGKTKTVWLSCLTTGGGTITALVAGVTFQGTSANGGNYAFITFDVPNGGAYNISLATSSTKIWIESI